MELDQPPRVVVPEGLASKHRTGVRARCRAVQPVVPYVCSRASWPRGVSPAGASLARTGRTRAPPAIRRPGTPGPHRTAPSRTWLSRRCPRSGTCRAPGPHAAGPCRPLRGAPSRPLPAPRGPWQDFPSKPRLAPRGCGRCIPSTDPRGSGPRAGRRSSS